MTIVEPTPIVVTASNAERIGKAVAEVAKRIRIQDFDVVGLQGTAYASADVVTVSVETRRDLNKAAAYFQLRECKDLAGDTTICNAGPVTGLRGALVEVFGPTTDGEADQ